MEGFDSNDLVGKIKVFFCTYVKEKEVFRADGENMGKNDVCYSIRVDFISTIHAELGGELFIKLRNRSVHA